MDVIFVANPHANTKLEEQDILIVLGEVEQVDRVRAALEGKIAFKKH